MQDDPELLTMERLESDDVSSPLVEQNPKCSGGGCVRREQGKRLELRCDIIILWITKNSENNG